MILWLLACAPGDIEVALSLAEEVSTVVELRASVQDLGLDEAWVEVQSEGGAPRELALPLEGADAGKVTLFGFKPESQVQVEVHGRRGGREWASAPTSITTGSIPSWLPQLHLETDDGGEHFEGGVLLTSIVTSPATAVLLDADGEYLWWARLEAAHQVGRVRMARDGSGILALPINLAGDYYRGLMRVRWDGEVLEDIEVDTAHHDFYEREDGRLLLLMRESREIEGQARVGDVLVEQDGEGERREIWNAWDHLDPLVDLPTLSGDAWTHANHLFVDEGAQTAWVGLHGVRTIVHLGLDGQTLGYLGGARSDYLDESGAPVEILGHHGFEPEGDRLLVFENGAGEEPTSRLREFRLDEAAGRAEEVWGYAPDPALYTFSLGGVDRLESGDTVVSFSVNGRLDEVDAAGALRWRLSASLGGTFGYVEVVKLPGQAP